VVAFVFYIYSMFSGIGILFILAIATAVVAIWTWTLLDIIRSNMNSTQKLVWILIVFFFPFLGTLIYAATGRKR